MPLKRAVIPLLDRIDSLVTEVGGANTVVFAAAQRLGYHPDGPGMVRALAEHGIGQSEPSGPAVILGGGVVQSGDLLLDPLYEALEKHVLTKHYLDRLTISTAELGDDAGLMGALAMARDIKIHA